MFEFIDFGFFPIFQASSTDNEGDITSTDNAAT